jgi:hypothetical protein
MQIPDGDRLQDQTKVEHVGAIGGSGVAGPEAARSTNALRDVTEAQRHELIATLAYSHYEQRGKAHGNALEDWLMAEREVHAALREGRMAVAHAATSAKEAFLTTLSTALAEGHGQLEELAAKAKTGSAALRRKYEQRIGVASAKYDAARSKFVEVRQHTDEAWGHLRDGAEKAAQEMRVAVRDLKSLLK